MKGKKVVIMSIVGFCLVLVGLLTPENAYAKSDSDFVIENKVLTKYQGAGSDVVIPDGVTAIGERAFDGCRNLIEITIPSMVTQIGKEAFRNTSWIKEREQNGMTIL